MFRPMRKKNQELSLEESIRILKEERVGVFALSDEKYPYALPMNYIYHQEKIYVHSAQKGHKIDIIKKSPRVSFCVIEKDTIVPEEFTTYFTSVIIFGEASLVEDEKERRKLITLLSDHFSPKELDRRDRVIERNWANLQMIEIRIDHLSGKKAAELISL